MWALRFLHLINLIAEAHLVDTKSMDNRPSALENAFFLFFMLIVLFVNLKDAVS